MIYTHPKTVHCLCVLLTLCYSKTKRLFIPFRWKTPDTVYRFPFSYAFHPRRRAKFKLRRVTFSIGITLPATTAPSYDDRSVSVLVCVFLFVCFRVGHSIPKLRNNGKHPPGHNLHSEKFNHSTAGTDLVPISKDCTHVSASFS